jgi:hypothetical protein
VSTRSSRRFDRRRSQCSWIEASLAIRNGTTGRRLAACDQPHVRTHRTFAAIWLSNRPNRVGPACLSKRSRRRWEWAACSGPRTNGEHIAHAEMTVIADSCRLPTILEHALGASRMPSTRSVLVSRLSSPGDDAVGNPWSPAKPEIARQSPAVPATGHAAEAPGRAPPLLAVRKRLLLYVLPRPPVPGMGSHSLLESGSGCIASRVNRRIARERPAAFGHERCITALWD